MWSFFRAVEMLVLYLISSLKIEGRMSCQILKCLPNKGKYKIP